MEVCLTFALLTIVVLLLACVGHGLWLILAAVVRAFGGAAHPGPAPPGPARHACARCGTSFSRRADGCPACGLDPRGAVAVELHELEITARQIQTLVEKSALPPAVGEQIYKQIEARQTALLGGPRPAAGEPLWAQLDRLLATCADVRDLTAARRKQARAWYYELAERRELHHLSAAGLLKLARLLHSGGLLSHPLEVYQLLLETHPLAPEAIQGAREAAQIADDESLADASRFFLEWLRQHGRDEEEQRDAGELLHRVPAAAAPERPPVPARPEPLAGEPPPAAASPPVESRRSLGALLAAFMEQRNILWGELVGGLLIVGCSIALVISLWQTLEQIPYFPFLILSAITAALFGAGHYTLHHWKLESTSRGLLVIATLLTPLDFLVVAGLARDRPTDWLDWAVAVGAVAGFTALVLPSARTLVGMLPALLGRPAWWLTLAVLGSSAGQLLVPRWVEATNPAGWFVPLGFLPVACQAAAVGAVLLPLARRDRLEGDTANALFLFLGQATFAAAVALGFLLTWYGDPLPALRHLALPVAVAGMPVLIGGALVHRLLEGAAPSAEGPGLSPAVARLVGTVVTLAGALVMLAALVLTWPRPGGLAGVAALNAVAFTAAALRYRLPVLHVPALGCVAVLWLVGGHGLLGDLPEGEDGPALLALALAPESGSLLAGLAVLLALAAEFGEWFGRRPDGLYHLAGAGGAAVGALLLVGRVGWDVPWQAAPVFAVCGVVALAVNARRRQPWLSYASALVLLWAIGYALRCADPGLSGVRLALLALLLEATWLLGLAFWLARGATRSRESAFVGPFRGGGLAASYLAGVLLVIEARWPWLREDCLCTFWLAALWLLTAVRQRRPGLFQAFQAAVTAAVLLGVNAWLGRPEQDWAIFWPDRLQADFLALAILSVVWADLRRVTRSYELARTLLGPAWGSVDRVVLAVVIIAQLIMAVGMVIPEAVREYVLVAPNQFAPQLQLYDPGKAWLLVGILGLVLTVHLGNGRPYELILGGVLLGLTVPLLAAHAFRGELAAASALRWGLALAFVGFSAPVWARRRLAWLGIEAAAPFDLSRVVRILLLFGALLPVLVMTWAIADLGFAGLHPAGPVPGSLFARMGWTVSAIGPLVLLVVGLVGHGLREDYEGYLFGAGLLATATLVGGYALGVVTGGGVIDTAEGVFLWHLAVLGLAVWGLAWLASGRWHRPSLLTVHIALGLFGVTFLVLALVWLTVGPFKYRAFGAPPPTPIDYMPLAGQPIGWLGMLLTLMLAVWYSRRSYPAGTIHLLGLAGVLLGIQAACTAALWDDDGWLVYHTLTLAWSLAGFVLLTGAWAGANLRRIGPGFWSDERRTHAATLLGQFLPAGPARYWVEAFCTAVALLALGGAAADPARPYWPCAVTLAVGVLLGADAVWSRRPPLVYAAGLSVNLAGFLLWRGWDESGGGPDGVRGFLYLQILCLGVASACWSLLEYRLRRREPSVDLRGRWIPFAHLAALAAVHLLALAVLVGLAGDCTRALIDLTVPLAWAALAAALAAVALCFWDPEATHWGLPAAPLYVCGLAALGLALHAWHLPARDLAWTGTVPLAGYLVLAAAAVLLVPRGTRLWRRLGIPARAESGLHPWFLTAQGLLGALVLGLSVWLCLDFTLLAQRLTGPAATALLTLTGVLLVQCLPALVPGEKPSAELNGSLRQGTLLLAFVTALELGWGGLGPYYPVLWLHRNVLLLAVLIVFAALYGSRLAGRLGRDRAWAAEARRLGKLLAGLAVAVLAVVLVQEFTLYDAVARRVPLAWPGVVLVGVLLAAILVGGLWVALNPRRDPFGLSDRGRAGVVYGAEILLVLLLVHLRLCVPDFFPGVIGQNWPLLLMALGFVGVGLAELFRRRGLAVLAGPLQQTGLFLPLVPLAAFLLRPLSELHARDALGRAVPGLQPLFRYLDMLPSQFGTHALLWFLLGSLYTLLAVLRRSSAFALLAAVAANFGLWVIYAHTAGLEFVLHPQLWLVPVGLIVLAAEHLNRPHLTASQSQGVRYAGLLLIYLSSTADLFITGLGNSVLLPVVLALLSVAGVLAGILLRVRAFLTLGVCFLFLVVFSQIWHAAVDRAQTWVWWASGIVLGVAILTLFALFEKRRNDVLRVLEEIKAWR